MNHQFEDLSPMLETHVTDVTHIMSALLPFHKAREETYKLSFAKRGESGVWLNLARKYDRLDPLAARVLAGDGKEHDGVTLIDTLVDTAMYSLKWLAVIRELRPETFDEWIKQVYCSDTGDTFDEACTEFNLYTVDGVHGEPSLTMLGDRADAEHW